MLNKKELILKFVKRNLLLIAGAFFFGFLSILFTIFIPVLIGKFYTLISNSNTAKGKLFDIIFYDINTITSYFLLFFLVLILRFVINYLQLFFTGIATERFSKSLREDLFASQITSPLSIFEKKTTGHYLLRYSGDLNTISNYLSKGVIGVTNDVLFIILTLVLFISMNIQLTLVVLIAFPLIFVLVYFMNQKLKVYSSLRRNLRSSNLAFVTSRLNALLTVKVFNRESIESKKFERKSNTLYAAGISFYKWYSLIESVLPLLLYAMLGVLLFVAFHFRNTVSGDQILIYIILISHIIVVLKRILKVNMVWQNGNISFHKLLDILNQPKEKKDEARELKIIEGKIVFNNLSLSYNNDVAIIKNLTTTIPGFGIYQLEGKQGSGKTLLLKTILALNKPTSGDIFIDGSNISDYSEFALRKQITLISDALPLLGKTIFEAISYSRKSEKKPEALALLSELNFTVKSDSILDYPIIDGGKNISTGQKKLLLIARAILTKKKIVLMDEPFIDLDESYKTLVSKLITNLRDDRTFLIISKEINNSLNYNGSISLDYLKK